MVILSFFVRGRREEFGLYETSIPIGYFDSLRSQSISIGLRILTYHAPSMILLLRE